MMSTTTTTNWLEILYNTDPLLFICNPNDFININFLSKMCSDTNPDFMKSLMVIAKSGHTVFGICVSKYILRIMHELRYAPDNIIYNYENIGHFTDINIAFSLGKIDMVYYNRFVDELILSINFKKG